MALDARKEAAWKSAFEKGSKKMQGRLRKIHADNPDFHEFVSKHGFGETQSKKQAEKQSVTKKKAAPKATPKGKEDRLAMIKAAQSKRNDRVQAAANRQAWGGELGGGFSMPGGSFRRYSESLHEARKKVLGFDVQERPKQLPAPKGGHKIPKGYERVKDAHGTNVLRKLTAERLELMKTDMAEAKEPEGYSWDSAIVRTRFGGVKTPKHKKDKFVNKVRRVVRKKIKKVLATEYAEMSSKEALQELKKSTYASYLQKAPKRVRSGTSIARGFEDDYYRHMKVSNDNSPNIIRYGGPEKDYEKGKKAEKSMEISKELQNTFKRSANNRIKGIQRAGRLLSKEEVEVECSLSENNTMARPEIWDTHELRGSDGKAIKKGQVVNDFRDEPHKVVGFAPPHKPSSSGRVYTKHGKDGDEWKHEGSFFPGVIGAEIHKKSAVKEAFVGLYKSKRHDMFETKQEPVAPVVEEEVVVEEHKPDYRDVRRQLVRKGK